MWDIIDIFYAFERQYNAIMSGNYIVEMFSIYSLGGVHTKQSIFHNFAYTSGFQGRTALRDENYLGDKSTSP